VHRRRSQALAKPVAHFVEFPKRSGVAVRRRGISLLEVFMTSALLGAALALLGPMVLRLAAHRESVDQQQWATAELNNVLEDYAGRPYNDVTTDAAGALTLSPAAAAQLKDGELTLDVADDPESDGRRLTARLRWKLASGTEKSVALSTWIHPEGP
jgi:hypothetical protein